MTGRQKKRGGQKEDRNRSGGRKRNSKIQDDPSYRVRGGSQAAWDTGQNEKEPERSNSAGGKKKHKESLKGKNTARRPKNKASWPHPSKGRKLPGKAPDPRSQKSETKSGWRRKEGRTTTKKRKKMRNLLKKSGGRSPGEKRKSHKVTAKQKAWFPVNNPKSTINIGKSRTGAEKKAQVGRRKQ